MSEAVIVFDKLGNISFINSSSEKLFGVKSENLFNEKLSKLSIVIEDLFLKKIALQERGNFEIELSIGETNKILLCSLSTLSEETGRDNYIAVIKDITETKMFEEQAKRNEKLSAMGELASGVAHEIRNPINAIGMIAQRLNKEFIPVENLEEYKKITELLRNEVNRINKIISQFLNYAKPLDLKLEVIKKVVTTLRVFINFLFHRRTRKTFISSNKVTIIYL